MIKRNLPDSVGFDPVTSTAHLTVAWEGGGEVVEAIVRGVAAVTGQRPEQLDPLHAAINPDALESLFTPTSATAPRNEGTVTFTYMECDITVRATGEVEIDTSTLDFGPA